MKKQTITTTVPAVVAPKAVSVDNRKGTQAIPYKPLHITMQMFRLYSLSTILVSICLLSQGCVSNKVCLNNEKLGYYIEFPATWELELSAISTYSIHSSNIWAPAPYHGLIVITMYDNYQSTAKEAAQAVVAQCRAEYQDVVVMVNKKVSDEWDWYVQLDYSDPGVGYLHDTYYYKQTDDRLYEVQTTGSIAHYEKLRFEDIIATFRLTNR